MNAPAILFATLAVVIAYLSGALRMVADDFRDEGHPSVIADALTWTALAIAIGLAVWSAA